MGGQRKHMCRQTPSRRRLLALLAAPFWGAAFCLFLPLIGFVLLGLVVKDRIYARREEVRPAL